LTLSVQDQPDAPVIPVPPPLREVALPEQADRLRRVPSAVEWERTFRAYYWRRRPALRHGRPHYYYAQVMRRLSHLVAPGARVLDIGCGTGELLAHLRPCRGLGIDFDARVIAVAQARHPHLDFRELRGEDVGRLGETFDYVIVNQALCDFYDVLELFRALQAVCHERTRLIIVHYSRLWQPLLRVAEWLGIKPAAPDRTWLPTSEVSHLLKLAGFDTIRQFGMTLLPAPIPLLSTLVNRFLGNLPGLHCLGLSSIVVARSVGGHVLQRGRERSVSIIVPARNEAGNIAPLLNRIPRLAREQEVIFVEGHSTDDTWGAIRRAAAEYEGPYAISCLQQEGKGKADAVRKGFAAARNDVLMILDADLSVPPEELRAFYDALIQGHGELINGSRMVYLMDRRAMRFLNLLGNKFFGWLFTTLLSQRFRDTLCGTKVLLRADYEQRLAATRAYFGDFDPFGDYDLLFGAAQAGLKIIDVPVHYKARTYGTTNISRFTHGLILLRMCLFAARKLKFI
jgi:SAM-dependent methyltransferase